MKLNRSVFVLAACAWVSGSSLAAGADYLSFRAEQGQLVAMAFSSRPSGFLLSDPRKDSNLSATTSDLNPAFDTGRFECRVDTYTASCFSSEQMEFPVCSPYMGMDDHFVKVSTLKSNFGNTPKERGTPSSWDKMSVGEKVATGAVGTVAVAIAAVPIAVVAGWVGVLGAISKPECVGTRTKWVEFDHDAFGKAARKAWEGGNLSARKEATASAAFRIEEIRNQLEDRAVASWGEQVLPMKRFSLVKPRAYFPLRFQSLYDTKSLVPSSIDVNVELEKYTAQVLETLQQASDDQIKAALGELAKDFRDWRVQHRETERQAFAAAQTSEQMQLFINTFEQYDEAALVEQARLQVVQLKRQEEVAAANRQAQDARELKLRQAAESKKRAEDDRKLASFRAGLKAGSETNCGPVLEVRPQLVKVAKAIANYGSEHWVRSSAIRQPGSPCFVVNGNIVDAIPPEVLQSQVLESQLAAQKRQIDPKRVAGTKVCSRGLGEARQATGGSVFGQPLYNKFSGKFLVSAFVENSAPPKLQLRVSSLLFTNDSGMSKNLDTFDSANWGLLSPGSVFWANEQEWEYCG